ncbi:SpoIIE family protein phosphatase [Streptacidiphilus sp. ASG 303]|uniref:PP2C family protein-serine/threonine phosphatase n=1 Tax=Streptacidiphilus sp. ASG 303 TaxID=2896847 RepID=UPI001E5D0984|nr:SpoIIE family protein phosphatase [Streptacidiphilus sp. ASG 303]MCD0482579.1 SpoIIE family protein phosphatase [Streptacidiphilus sp. ASG 303]
MAEALEGVPAPRRNADAVLSGTLEASRSAWPGDPVALLLVEDDPGDALLVEELLADSGISAALSWARSLADARRVLAEQGVPGCILLDLHLPDAHGLDAVTQLLAAAPGAAVVVLTGLAEEASGLAAVAAGAQDYLVKGQLEPQLFGRAVRYAAQRKQVEQAAAALQVERVRAQENSRLERGLLPVPLLRGDGFEVVSRYRPGRAQALLGGDFYDVVETADGTVHAVVGDVSGHGPAEAALGVCLRVAWRSFVLAGSSGSTLMELLEQILVAERDGEQLFATLTSLSFTPDRRRVRVVRAGHPGMLQRVGGDVEWVEPPGGPALGLLPGLAHWPQEELPLPPGAGLALFTDGLFEGHTGRGRERLGERGLLALARKAAGLASDLFVDTLISDAEAAAAGHGGLADDVALVHLGWKQTDS